MANKLFDDSGMIEALNRLSADLRPSLARSMCVAGGQILRDEAKSNVHDYEPGVGRNGNSPQRINQKARPGQLREAIYLAFANKLSDDHAVTYRVSWNEAKAPHGHLVEFGHDFVVGGKKGKNGRVVGYVPAYPFLRPAFDLVNGPVKQAMIDRGRERLPELLAGIGLKGDK